MMEPPVMPGVALTRLHVSDHGWEIWHAATDPPQWFEWTYTGEFHDSEIAWTMTEAEAMEKIVRDKRNAIRRMSAALRRARYGGRGHE